MRTMDKIANHCALGKSTTQEIPEYLRNFNCAIVYQHKNQLGKVLEKLIL